MLVLSDPIWLQPPSGYSKVADMLCALLNKDGHSVGHVPIYEGIRGTSMLKGHAMTWKNTLLLEDGGPSDPMSEQSSLRHYYDFKADFLLTFKNVWNFRALMDYPTNWIPTCVTGDTLVNCATNGTVLGLNNAFEATMTPMLYWIKKPIVYPLYYMRTSLGNELKITGNSKILVLEKNSPVWKRVENVKCGELVICNYGNFTKPIKGSDTEESQLKTLDEIGNSNSEKELSENDRGKYTEKIPSIQVLSFHIPQGTNSPLSKNSEVTIRQIFKVGTRLPRTRMGLPCRTNRWRRNLKCVYLKKETSKKKNILHSDACFYNSQHRQKNDRLDKPKNRCVQIRNGEAQKDLEDLLPSHGSRLQNIPHSKRSQTLLNNEEGTLRASDAFYSDTNDQTLPRPIRRRSNKDRRENSESTDFETAEISQLKRIISKEPVYDLTTLTHNYFANNILIHNCFIDHRPVSNEVTARLKTTFQVITVSRFGKRELKKAGLPSTYIPLFVDTNLYKPMDKAEAREPFGLPPDCFGILIMGMNRRRKMIPRMYRACKRFLDNNPDAQKDTKIISWNRAMPEFFTEDGARGTILSSVVRRLELDPYIFFPSPKLYETGLEEWRMPLIYNAANCILCASAEGFWLPGVEAGACGVPAVTVEHAAAPEVTTGELARVADWDVMNPVGYDQPLVDIDDMAEGIAKIYNGDQERYARQAREYSLKYDVQRVYQKYWKPFLDKINPMLRPLVTKSGIKSWEIA